MKHIFFLLSFMLLCSCSSNQKQPDEQGQPESVNTELLVDCEDEMIRPEIVDVISSAYDLAFNSVDTRQAIEEYCTKEFREVQQKYEEINEGAIGSLDYDVWYQAQDAADPAIMVKIVSLKSDNEATVVIELTNFGETQEVTLPLVVESGEWRIDDFIGNAGSAVQTMKANLK